MENYINLSGIVEKVTDQSSGYAVQSWLRNRNTLEFLMLWETKHNPNFDKVAYDELFEKTKENGFTLTPKIWIERTKAIGLTSKIGRNGGTFAVTALACEFMMNLSPAYRLAMVETFMLTDEGSEIL